MAIPVGRLPGLRVIDGGSPAMRSDENRIELLTFFLEVEEAARVITNAVTGLLVPSALAINEANRMGYRARAAREEYLSLTGPKGAA